MVVKSTHIIHLEQYFKYDTVLEQVSIVNLKMPIITKENKIRVNRDGRALKQYHNLKYLRHRSAGYPQWKLNRRAKLRHI